MKNVTRELVGFVVEASYEDLPQDVVHETKRVLLDSVGCALAGLSTDKGKVSVEVARRLGGPPEATILGLGDKVSCASAALANGELINALDYDAILYPSIHIPPNVIPAPLAIAEWARSSGRELILALALAHEVAARVGSGLEPSTQVVAQGPERGKVTRPDTYGLGSTIFGGVAGAGKLLGFSAEKMAHAFGIAGYHAPVPAMGRWASSGTAAMTKYLSSGCLSQTEVTVVLLADRGYTGDETVLDGELGFWKLFGSRTWDPDKVTHKLGEVWHVPNMRYKPYPVCGLNIGALHVFARLIEENKLSAEEMESVRVLMDPSTDKPLWHNREIETEIQAQFSVAYAFAVVAQGVPVSPLWQDRATTQDPRIREFMGKVSFSPHPDFGRVALERPGARLTTVEVTARGQTFKAEGTMVPGSATSEARLSDDYLAEKFATNASRVLPQGRIARATEALLGLERVDSVPTLMELLAINIVGPVRP